MVGFFDEPVFVVSEGMRLKHLQHFRAGPLHDCDACQERRSDVERQNWMLGRGRKRNLVGEDVIEIRDNGTKNSIAPEFGVAREWPWCPAHQQEAGKFQRRRPGLDVAFCIIVEQPLSTKCGIMILIE